MRRNRNRIIVCLTSFTLTLILLFFPSNAKAQGYTAVGDSIVSALGTLAGMAEIAIPDLRGRFGSDVGDRLVLSWPLQIDIFGFEVGSFGMFADAVADLQWGTTTEELAFAPGVKIGMGGGIFGAQAEVGGYFADETGWWVGGGPVLRPFSGMEHWDFGPIVGLEFAYRYVNTESTEWHEFTGGIAVSWSLRPMLQ